MRIIKVSYADEVGNHVLTHMIVHSNPSVAIIVRKGGQIALIKQFRSTTGKEYIELPAGVINEGENAVQAAIRETREETGLLVKNVMVLVKGPSLLDPSKSDEDYGVAVADVIGEKDRCLDEMEQIDSNIIWLSEKEAFEHLRNQMFKGEPFMDDLFMSGHSLYALMAYMLSK